MTPPVRIDSHSRVFRLLTLLALLVLLLSAAGCGAQPGAATTLDTAPPASQAAAAPPATEPPTATPATHGDACASRHAHTRPAPDARPHPEYPPPGQ